MSDVEHLFMCILNRIQQYIKRIIHCDQMSFIPGIQEFFSSVAQPWLTLCASMNCRLSCPSPTPGACSHSCPSNWWCHPTISSSVVPFSSCLQSFLASGSFPMSQLFAWGSQSTGISASVPVLTMNTQDWSPLGLTAWNLLAVQETLDSLLQHHRSKASILWHLAFFIV